MELKLALEIERHLRYTRSTSDGWGKLAKLEVFDALLSVIDDLRTPVGTEYDADQVVMLYHQHLPMLPRVSLLTQQRRKKIVARWTEAQRGKPSGQRAQFLDWWEHTFRYAAQSDFLTGRRSNDRGWRPNIDFFLQSSSLIKLQEGSYHTDPATSDAARAKIAHWMHEQR